MTRTLSLTEAAQVLKTTAETVSDAIHHRGLPAAKIGRAQRLALAEMLDRVEVDPEAKPPLAVLHYALQRGDMLASPRVGQVSPLRWASQPVPLAPSRRRA